MIGRGWCLLPLVLLACDGESDTAVIVVDDGCPVGMDRASSSGMLITQLNLDGLLLMAGYDPIAIHDGEPAGCVTQDGTSAKWTFEVDDLPYGTLSLSGVEAGGHDLNTEGGLMLALHGADVPVTFRSGASQWQSGTWYVVSASRPLDVELVGTANSGGRSLSIQLTAQASP